MQLDSAAGDAALRGRAAWEDTQSVPMARKLAALQAETLPGATVEQVSIDDGRIEVTLRRRARVRLAGGIPALRDLVTPVVSQQVPLRR